MIMMRKCERCGAMYDDVNSKGIFLAEHPDDVFDESLEGLCPDCVDEYLNEVMPAGAEMMDMLEDDD